jgi:hypothetical protein
MELLPIPPDPPAPEVPGAFPVHTPLAATALAMPERQTYRVGRPIVSIVNYLDHQDISA